MKKLIRYILYLCVIFSLMVLNSGYKVLSKELQINTDYKSNSLLTTYLNNQEFCKYSPLTSKQLKLFLSQKKLLPLATKNIGNYTMILFVKDSLFGSYILSSNSHGDINESLGISNLSVKNSVSVMTSYSNGFEDVASFVGVIINNNELYKKAHYLKIILNNKAELSVDTINSKGLIIPCQCTNIHLSTIIIYDKKNKVIYKKTY